MTTQIGHFFHEDIIDILSYVFRNEDWEKNGPSEKEQPAYDGPPGMDPDGIIESNWEEVVDNFDDMNLKEELLRGKERVFVLFVFSQSHLST